MTLKIFMLAALSCVCLNAGTIIYSDFGAGQAYDNSAGWNVGAGSSVATGFDPSASGTLSQVDVALENLGAIEPLSIMVETDSGGTPSGTVLDSWMLSTSSIASMPQTYTLSSSLNPALTAGTEYWLVLSSTDPNDSYAWMENSTGTTGKDYNNGSGWQIQPSLVTPAFDVETGSASVPTPEPATLGFTALGFLALFAARSIYEKLQVHSKSEAVAKTLRNRLV
jgi:hypothetical protein